MADLLWVDYTRRGDPAQEFYVARLKSQLDAEGYPRVLCFWTKAPQYVGRVYHALIDRLHAHGTLVLAQVTLNGYGRAVEPGVTPARTVLQPLVERLGPAAIRLRFDPLIPGYTDLDTHFAACLAAAQAAGITHITTNFFSPYPKALARLRQAGIVPETWDEPRRIAFLTDLVERANAVGIQVAACAETARYQLFVPGLLPAACADGAWAAQLRPELAGAFKNHPSRPGCGCVYSGDWGLYKNQGGPSCPHHCTYCYAQ